MTWTRSTRPDGRRAAMAMLAAVALVACGHSEPATAVVRIATSHGTVAVRGPVADTDAARARGLQGRTTLGSGQGMAFLFDHPTDEAFWMKGTAVPLSVAFWNGNDRIVAIMDMVPCPSDRCRTYQPTVPYVGAVEARRGWFEANGVRVGDRVELQR